MSLEKKQPYENWTLKKVKVKPSADSVDFQSDIRVADGPDVHVLPKNGPYPIPPHPDLTNELRKLKPILSKYYAYQSFIMLTEDKNFQATAAQKKYARNLYDELMNDMEVTGIAFAGREKKSVSITGMFRGNSINTKPLYFTNEEYGEMLEETCENICMEVYQYIYEGKKAQLDMLFQ